MRGPDAGRHVGLTNLLAARRVAPALDSVSALLSGQL
jgi:hypothetical protein